MAKELYEEFGEMSSKLDRLAKDMQNFAKLSKKEPSKEVDKQKQTLKSMTPIKQLTKIRPTIEAAKEAQKEPDMQEFLDRLDAIFEGT